MLEVQKLIVSYDKKDGEGPVLKGVDLRLDGDKAVIVGPNGSGKSTLFRAILGLVPIQSGNVKLFGKDIKATWNELRVSTNIIDVYRLANIPGKDLVKLFADLKEGDAEEVFSLFEEFDLAKSLTKKIHEMSTGQQKMFGNLMALGFRSELILLDEPFDNVDEGRRRKVLEILRSISSEMIIITHEFNLLKNLPDWGLYIMLEGKLWGRFSTSQLDRLYISKGEIQGALQVMETSIGKLSILLDSGELAIKSVSSANALLEQI